MPSVGEIFTVWGVAVGIGVSVASGVAVNGIEVAVGMSVVVDSTTAVGAGGVLVL